MLNFGRPGFVALGDLNKDGKLDIVAGATVLLNNGNGAFGPPFEFGMGSLGSGPGANTVIADFDGDSNLDIASAATGSAGYCSATAPVAFDTLLVQPAAAPSASHMEI